MGERALENRVKKLKDIELKQAELAEQAEEIKTYMIESGKDEINAAEFVVRLKEIVSKRFDSKLFKQEHKALYAAYMKPTSTTRFTIA